MNYRDVNSAGTFASVLLASLLISQLGGCGGTQDQAPGDGPPDQSFDPSSVPDAVPRKEPRSRYGNAASYKVYGRTYHTLDTPIGYRDRGIASWYGRKFHGRLTSSREPYDMYAMSAAHRTLPLPSYVRVTHLGNGRSVVLRVNDRGPFHNNRIIDLSYAAAAKLDMLRKGTAPVEVETLIPGQPSAVVAQAPPMQPIAEPGQPSMFLQVGAFADRGNAQRLYESLSQALAEPVLIQPHHRDGLTLYRVRIGPLPSVRLVDQLSGQLQQMGHEEFRVVIE